MQSASVASGLCNNPRFYLNEFKKAGANYLTYHYDNGQIADENNSGYWQNPIDDFFGMLINAPEKRIYIAMSKNDEKLNIILPKNKENHSWHICLDSSIFANIDLKVKDYIERNYILNPQSLAIFTEVYDG